jgi:predicted transcriptional regulator
MDGPLNEISFLSRSENRIKILETLANGEYDRDELSEATGVSKATLKRIISDFERLGWIERNGRDYAASTAGRALAEEFSQLVATVKTIRTFDDLLPWLPVEEMPFDLWHLADAEVISPTETDPIAPSRAAVQCIHSAEQVRVATNSVLMGSLETIRDAVVDGRLAFEGVFSARLLATVRTDPLLAAVVYDLLNSDRSTIVQHGSRITCDYCIVDDSAVLCVVDDDSLPRALVISGDKRVVEWVDETIDAYQAGAERIDPSSFEAKEALAEAIESGG